jgi:hypothetical protein
MRRVCFRRYLIRDLTIYRFRKSLETVVRFPRKLVFWAVEFVIETELSEEVVVERLQAIVEPRSPIIAPLVPTNKLFAGEVSSRGFEMMRIIGYGNGSLPVISGHFEPGLKGARVRVTTRLTRVASLSGHLALFIFAVLFTCGSIAVWKQSGADAMLLIVATCLVAAWVIWITTRGESYEERRARVLLEETLQTTPSLRIQRILSGVAPRRIRGVVFLVGLGLILYALISRIVHSIF